MSMLCFGYKKTALISSDSFLSLLSKIKPTIQKIKKVYAEKNYNDLYGSINLPFDEQLLHDVQNLVAQKKKLHPCMMIVVGIGGSNLGTQAVYEAIYGKEGSPDFPLYFADTVDADVIARLLARMQQALQEKKTVLLTVISKSGSTTETVANFECFLALLQKYHPDSYHENIVAITDEHSALWKLAHAQRFATLAIPKNVGGRYSVLSAVGLFPLACAGIDIEQLREGARMMLNQCILHSEENYAAASAAIIAYHYGHHDAINDLFLFSTDLETVGKWYRQLMGESIGKMSAQQISVGILPTVSIGSTDLHSVGQLYLGGSQCMLTTFVTVQKNMHDVKIPCLPEYESLVKNIQGKSLAAIMDAIYEGVQCAYQEKKLPFMTIEIPQKNAFYIGQFLQYKMLEIMYLGALLEVNPFDQPQVELYKQHTRKILADE